MSISHQPTDTSKRGPRIQTHPFKTRVTPHGYLALQQCLLCRGVCKAKVCACRVVCSVSDQMHRTHSPQDCANASSSSKNRHLHKFLRFIHITCQVKRLKHSARTVPQQHKTPHPAHETHDATKCARDLPLHNTFCNDALTHARMHANAHTPPHT